MALRIYSPEGDSVAEVDQPDPDRHVQGASPLHSSNKPVPYSGTRGHYRISVAFSAAKASGARVFSFRNGGSLVMVPIRMVIAIPVAGGSGSAGELLLSLYRATGFTATDSTASTSKNGSLMRAGTAPANAAELAVTTAASGGMTGGTFTKDADPLASCNAWLPATTPTTSTPPWLTWKCLDNSNGDHSLAFAQNEGMILEVTSGGTFATNGTAYIDLSWAEVTVF